MSTPMIVLMNWRKLATGEASPRCGDIAETMLEPPVAVSTAIDH